MQTDPITNILDAQTLLDAITIPCLVIDKSGQVRASNHEFKNALHDVDTCRLESILDEPDDITDVMKRIIRNRRAQFHDLSLDPLISRYYIQSIRMSFTFDASPLFLIEFHKRKDMSAPFRALYVQRKDLISAQSNLIQTKASLKKAHLKAYTDALTGIANRRAFNEHLKRMWVEAYKERQSLSLVLLDLDFFKAINDKQGHAEGDRVLKEVASVLSKQVTRKKDLVCRFGGEEFAVILYGADSKGASTISLRLVGCMSDLAISHPNSPISEFVTISAGSHTVNPTQLKPNINSLIHGADLALYKAKEKGRNRAYHRLLGKLGH